uniref:Secreted protein n=1 Tax=Astyanax mexicanus TaxID=7994 RepID=A0A3B1JEL3_ASTMX
MSTLCGICLCVCMCVYICVCTSVCECVSMCTLAALPLSEAHTELCCPTFTHSPGFGTLPTLPKVPIGLI